MASTNQQSVKFPTTLSGKFPSLHLPDEKITAPVKVRLGDTVINAVFPPKK